MESANSRLRDRAEKLRSQLETLKKEVNVANVFLQEVLDRNVQIVEGLESVTVTQIYLREYTKVQKFLLKHINFVTEVNCHLEILVSNESPDLNCSSGPEYSYELGLQQDSLLDDTVFQFCAEKKVSNLEHSVNAVKGNILNNIDEKAQEPQAKVSLGKKLEEVKKEKPESNLIENSKKKVLDPKTWTEAPVFVPKQAVTVSVSNETNKTPVEPFKASNPVVTEVSTSLVYPAAQAKSEPQLNPYPAPLYYSGIRFPPAPRVCIPTSAPVPIQTFPLNIPGALSWPPPYIPPPKPPLAVTRNPIKIEAPKPKTDTKKPELVETKSQKEKNVPEIKNKSAEILPKNQTAKTEGTETSIGNATPENVNKNVKVTEEKGLEEHGKKKDERKEQEDNFEGVAVEEKSTRGAVGDSEVFTGLIPEMNISREPGTKYQVVFDHLVSPGEFYVQILCPQLILMREMTKELEGYFKNGKILDREYQSKELKNTEKKNLAKKQIVKYGLCYTVDDPSWARVEIVDWRLEKDDDAVSVFFVDYGDTKDISLSYVQPMIPKFMKYPKFAQRCHLAEIYPADSDPETSNSVKWNNEAVTMFEILLESMSHDFSCYILVCEHDKRHDEKSLPVKFFLSEDGSCINKKLVEFEYAVEARSSPLPPKPDESDEELKDAIKAATPEPFSPGEVISVEMTCLIKLNKFYCVKEFASEELQKLNLLMNKPENVKDMLVLSEPPKVNQIVIGKYEEDNMWYRARVTKSEPLLNRYKLLFLDYGNYQNVTIENIRKIDKKFLVFPFQVIECYLSGIELLDSGKSEASMNYFLERVSEGELSIKIVSCRSQSTSSYEVVLYDKKGLDVGDDLVSKNYAKKT